MSQESTARKCKRSSRAAPVSRHVDTAEPAPQLDVKAGLHRVCNLEAKRNEAEQQMSKLLEED
jgi:hypothetical protein